MRRTISQARRLSAVGRGSGSPGNARRANRNSERSPMAHAPRARSITSSAGAPAAAARSWRRVNRRSRLTGRRPFDRPLGLCRLLRHPFARAVSLHYTGSSMRVWPLFAVLLCVPMGGAARAATGTPDTARIADATPAAGPTQPAARRCHRQPRHGQLRRNHHRGRLRRGQRARSEEAIPAHPTAVAPSQGPVWRAVMPGSGYRIIAPYKDGIPCGQQVNRVCTGSASVLHRRAAFVRIRAPLGRHRRPAVRRGGRLQRIASVRGGARRPLLGGRRAADEVFRHASKASMISTRNTLRA